MDPRFRGDDVESDADSAYIRARGFGAIFGRMASGAIGWAYFGSGTDPVTSCDE